MDKAFFEPIWPDSDDEGADPMGLPYGAQLYHNSITNV